MSHYQKPPELYEGLRLHQNENTGGCSPRVIEALARLAPAILPLARAEGLEAHAESIEVRLR
jgi:histidinol dehydrogenase